MTKSIDELFKSITAKESTWLGVLTAKLKCKQDASDAYQNVNCKILEAIASGKINIESIIDASGNIHYGYYHRAISNEAINFLREKKKGRERLVDFQLSLNVNNENNSVNYKLAEDIIKDQEATILIANKVKGVSLMEIAKSKELPFKAIWNQKEKEIYELREKYKEAYN